MGIGSIVAAGKKTVAITAIHGSNPFLEDMFRVSHGLFASRELLVALLGQQVRKNTVSRLAKFICRRTTDDTDSSPRKKFTRH